MAAPSKNVSSIYCPPFDSKRCGKPGITTRAKNPKYSQIKVTYSFVNFKVMNRNVATAPITITTSLIT
jgi:hypothetical protein